jgi:ribonuclease J
MREQEEIMNGLRNEVRRAVSQRYKRIDIDRFKAELKDHITHYLFEQTGRSPIVIPVVNIIGGKSEKQGSSQAAEKGEAKPAEPQKTPEQIAADQQARFQAMRERLLNQDPRVD